MLPIVVATQALRPAVGWVETTTLPWGAPSVATQSGGTVGVDRRRRGASSWSSRRSILVATVQLIDVRPAGPPPGASAVSIRTGLLHFLRPPVGVVVQIILPASSTAAQKVVVGHEMLVSEWLRSAVARCQFPLPIGVVDESTRPDWSTATQSLTDGQAIELSPPKFDLSILIGLRHLIEIFALVVVVGRRGRRGGTGRRRRRGSWPAVS